MFPELLFVTICLFVLCTRAQRVSPQLCKEIRSSVIQWKPFPSDPYNDADLIVPGLYLGNVCAAHNDSWLDEEKITAVISVAREWSTLPYEGGRAIEFYHYPMDDTSTQHERTVRRMIRNVSTLIDQLVTMGEGEARILVHCNMGISRSSTVVIHYLQEYVQPGATYRIAESFVKKKRPVIKPNSLFRRILVKEDL